MKQSINIRCTQHFFIFCLNFNIFGLWVRYLLISWVRFSVKNECMYLDKISRKQWYRVHVQTMVQK